MLVKFTLYNKTNDTPRSGCPYIMKFRMLPLRICNFFWVIETSSTNIQMINLVSYEFKSKSNFSHLHIRSCIRNFNLTTPCNQGRRFFVSQTGNFQERWNFWDLQDTLFMMYFQGCAIESTNKVIEIGIILGSFCFEKIHCLNMRTCIE